MNFRVLFQCVWILLFIGVQNANAADYDAQLLSNHKIKVEPLKWDSPDRIPVELINQGNETILQAKLDGSVIEKHQSLLINSTPIQLTNDRFFEIKISLTGEKTAFIVNLIADDGEINSLEYTILFPHWEEYRLRIAKKKIKNQNIGAKARIGIVTLTYYQSGYSMTSQTSFLGSLSFSRYLNKTSIFDYGINSYLTFLPMASAGDSNLKNQIQIFGLNVHMGVEAPFVDMPWGLKLTAGYYLNTMLGSASIPGYVNINGPELGPNVSYTLKNNSVASWYFKYSAMTSGIQFLSLNNSIIETGITYEHPFQKNKAWLGALIYSLLNITYLGSTIQCSTLSLTGGFGL